MVQESDLLDFLVHITVGSIRRQDYLTQIYRLPYKV